MAISRKHFLKISVILTLALGMILNPQDAAGKSRPAKNKKLAKRVLIITFDGIRVDGLAQANTPNIDALIAEGSASMATRDVMPSVTLPNYTSHLLGAGPEVHGVVNNGWMIDDFKIPAVETDADGYFPSVYKVLKDNVPGIKTAYYFNWKPLIRPLNQKYMDDILCVEDSEYPQLYDKAMGFIKENSGSPQFIFLYSGHTDEVGHKCEWMSPEYIKSIEDGDAQVGRMIEFLKAEGLYEDTHIFFFSDHGGVGKGHGGVSEAEMVVPWVLRGPGIKEGFTITEPNNTVNTASTILRLFGLCQPLSWTGEVPCSIFK